MHELLTLPLKNNVLKFEVVEGAIVEERKWTESKVISSSPGGGWVGPNGGYVSGPTVRTRNIPHHNLWIKDHNSGNEFPLDLGNKDIPLRAGHEIFIVKADTGENNIRLAFIGNRSTQKVYHFIKDIRAFAMDSAKIKSAHGFLRFFMATLLALITSIIVGITYSYVATSIMSTKDQLSGIKQLTETIHIPADDWKAYSYIEQYNFLCNFRLGYQAKITGLSEKIMSTEKGFKVFDKIVKQKFGVSSAGFIGDNAFRMSTHFPHGRILPPEKEKEVFQFVNGYPQDAYEQSLVYREIKHNAQVHGLIVGLCFCLISIGLSIWWAVKPLGKHRQEVFDAESKVRTHFEQLANALLMKKQDEVVQ